MPQKMLLSLVTFCTLSHSGQAMAFVDSNRGQLSIGTPNSRWIDSQVTPSVCAANRPMRFILRSDRSNQASLGQNPLPTWGKFPVSFGKSSQTFAKSRDRLDQNPCSVAPQRGLPLAPAGLWRVR